MPTFRCSTCGINYPPSQQFGVCPIHESQNAWFPSRDPDDDWEWQATAVMMGVNRAEPPEIPLKVNVTVHKTPEGYWINSHDLIRAGVHERLPTFYVLEIPTGELKPKDHPCDCMWEVMGYRESSREYWVRPIRVPDVPPA